MLSLASGSKCDVCYEAFGKERKAPCSIPCGHVFCSDCISNISRSCPLCRTHFDQDSWIKLHVDVESRIDCSPDDVHEAEELRAAIVKMAEEGTDELNAKQQMQDTKQFLARHPKDLFRDLRILTRMFIFMCETRTNLRVQRHQNDLLSGQFHTLSEERADLMQRLAESEEARKYERDTALAVERSLREHNALAVRNYTLLIQAYNKLAQSTADLLKQPHTHSYASSEKGSGFADGIVQTPINTLLPALDNALEGVAVRDSESSFMISPLPQFTGVLPSFLDGLTPLPELTEDVEGEEKEDDEEISTPDSIQNAHDMEGTHDFRRQSSGESLGSRPLDCSQEPKPSGLTRTAPHRRARSRSIPSRSTSPSMSPSVRSASASPPAAPPHHLMPTAHIRPGSYPHNTRDSYGSPSSRLPDGDALRSRLHDILSDTPTSSSLPNMPSSQGLPSSASTEREVPAHAPSASPTIRNGPSNSRKPVTPALNSSSDGVSHLLASGSNQQTQNKHAPAPSPVPFVSQRYSSASSEAKKLEEERRRKQREMHLETRKEDRERYKDGEVRKRDDRYGMDYERGHAHGEREYPTQISSSTGSTRRDQAANQKYFYSGTSNSNPPSLKRKTSSGNTYGQPTVVPPMPVQEHASGHHARHAGVSSGHKSRPVPIPTHTNTYT